MGFIQKEWINPISVNATELNRIEKGVKDSQDSIEILGGEISNLQLKQRQAELDIQNLTNNSNILETLTNLQAIVNNNSSLIETLQNTSNLVTQAQLSSSLSTFLRLTDIKQDGQSIVNGSEVNITTPTIDKILNRTSNNAISNKAVTLAFEELTSAIHIPTKLRDLQEDPHHLLVTENEKALWNSIQNISFTETDPTVPNWAKQSSKPQYEWIEILNTPEIHTQISEFPDVNNFSRINHDHDNRYALVQHDHDNKYAQILHSHLEYASAAHNHDDLYAAKNHTHNFDTSTIEEALANEINARISQGNNLRALIDALSMDYNDLENLPDLSIYALASDLTNHNHDTQYAALNHTHNYAAADHNHDTIYASISHTHDYSAIYAAINHNHDTVYSQINHNHDGRYSLSNHTHDLDYASLLHNHDTAYAALNHSHSNYALTTHTHDYSSVYAAINHNHNSDYATINHTHTEFSNIVDITTIQGMIDTSIVSLINGAPTTLDTLKELADAIGDNADLISALDAAISNHNHDSQYAPLSHTHSGYASSSHTHTASNITDLNSVLGNYALTSHTHSGYAASNHTHDYSNTYAAINHTHSGYAASNHTHSGYASSTHNHDSIYLKLSGGTLTGPLKLTGGSGTTDGSIQLDNTNNSQIADTANHTIFGFRNNETSNLYLGASAYALKLRGSATRPTYNNNNIALYSDITTITTTSGSESISDGTNTLNIVTLDTTQSISGQKTFTGNVYVPDVTIS